MTTPQRYLAILIASLFVVIAFVQTYKVGFNNGRTDILNQF